MLGVEQKTSFPRSAREPKKRRLIGMMKNSWISRKEKQRLRNSKGMNRRNDVFTHLLLLLVRRKCTSFFTKGDTVSRRIPSGEVERRWEYRNPQFHVQTLRPYPPGHCRRLKEALNVRWLLETQEEARSRSGFTGTPATWRSRSMTVFGWWKIKQKEERWTLVLSAKERNRLKVLNGRLINIKCRVDASAEP